MATHSFRLCDLKATPSSTILQLLNVEFPDYGRLWRLGHQQDLRAAHLVVGAKVLTRLVSSFWKGDFQVANYEQTRIRIFSPSTLSLEGCTYLRWGLCMMFALSCKQVKGGF